MFPRMHISLYVSDIVRTVNFYESFFNKRAEKIKDDYAKFILESPSLIISFVQNSEKVSSSFGHLGFQVETEEQLNNSLQAAKQRGLVYLEELGTNCCYATQDKYWAKDPDGYMWEVYLFHQDAEFNDPRYASKEAVACCTPTEKPKVKISDIHVNESCTSGSGCC